VSFEYVEAVISSYRENAAKMQHFTQLSGGATLAADICEKALSTGKPVF
jgi:UDP:flavonoid glycosyltransferase YjiC (YdhE family)